MNMEVCKRCNRVLQFFKGEKQYTVACYDDDLHQCFLEFMNMHEGNDLLKHSEIINHRNDEYGEYFWIKFKDYADIKENHITIWDCCPYHMEHWLSDLNKKKPPEK